MDRIKYGLCGKKLSHSYSEIIHKMLGNDEYRLLELSEEEIKELLEKKSFSALNITIPYKETAYKLCDVRSPEAKRIGCVNTVINRGGRLFGYNTDIFGFLFTVKRSNIDFSGKKVLILGSGGTSKTALYCANALGAENITVISRSGENNYANISLHGDAEIIVNTTPVGMYPENGKSPVVLDIFKNLRAVIDVIYNPVETRLIYDAKSKGIPTADGLFMLASQAVCADALFFGKELSEKETLEKADFVYKNLIFGTRNILLVGMPGCGKTTLGKMLAETLSRSFIDSDKAIFEKTGRTPEEIIVNDGEEQFRKIETEVLSEITKKSSCVIAVGGGAVIKPENRYYMRQNSFVIYLERELDKLDGGGRPLSQGGIETLERLYRERRELYETVSHARMMLADDAQENIKGILDIIRKA